LSFPISTLFLRNQVFEFRRRSLALFCKLCVSNSNLKGI
jgi:hypothetical protein